MYQKAPLEPKQKQTEKIKSSSSLNDFWVIFVSQALSQLV